MYQKILLLFINIINYLSERLWFFSYKSVLIVLCIILGASQYVSAQSNFVLVTNPSEEKALLIAEKDYISVRYQGYQNQTTFCKGVITHIDSTTMTILVKHELGRKSESLHVQIADITGIKQLSLLAEVAASVATIGSSAGSYVLLGSLGLTPVAAFAGSAAIGLCVHFCGIKILNQYKMRYQTLDGWQLKYIRI